MSREGKPCPCGSGQPCWALNDARGIFVAYVCDGCEAQTRKGYRTDIFEDPGYDVDEPIEPEDY